MEEKTAFLTSRNRREEFWDLSRSVARSVRKHVRTRDELRPKKARALI
jgi:hypothetical protein